MQYHEAANLFPLDEATLGALANDLAANGLHHPIEIMDGKILDGRRRWLACQKADVKPEFKEVKPKDPIAYVLSLNLHRRHLIEAQRAMVAAKIANMTYGGDRKSEEIKQSIDCLKSVSIPEAAKMVNVGEATVGRAKRVLRDAVPEVVTAVEKGELKVMKAVQISKLPKEEQCEAMKKSKSPKKQQQNGQPQSELGVDEGQFPRAIRMWGVKYANLAIKYLSRIPKNDPSRKRGFQIVKDWLRNNK